MGVRGATLGVAVIIGCKASATFAASPDSEHSPTAIVGGDLVATGTYAATGALLSVGSGTPSVVCSGTLIAPNAVLTAAHCIVLNQGVALKFTLALDVTALGDSSYDVSARYTDPSFELDPANPSVPLHDIGIVMLSQPIAGASFEHVAPGANPLLAQAGDSIALVGYGPTTLGGGEGAQNAGVAVITNLQASEFTVGPGPPPHVQACVGDSGGPAYLQSSSGERVLVGVASRAANENDPTCSLGSIYTRADAHAEWIASVLAPKKSGCNAVPESGELPGTIAGAIVAIGLVCRRRSNHRRCPI